MLSTGKNNTVSTKVSYLYSCIRSFCVTNTCPQVSSKEIPSGLFGKFRFLTYQNVWLQLVTYILCLASNFSPRFKAISEYFLGSLALPISISVVINFWPVFLYDRELILPVAFEKNGSIPPWLNYIIHLAILPVNLIQYYLDPPKYVSDKASLGLLYTYATFYISMLFIHRFYEGHYVYPFLDKYNNFQVAGTLILSLGFAYLSYRLGKCLSSFFSRCK